MKKGTIAVTGLACVLALAGVTGCSNTKASSSESSQAVQSTTDEDSNATEELDLSSQRLSDEDISTSETYEDSSDGGHAITADGETTTYSNFTVTKTGDSDDDEADFYGENASVFATNGATLTLSDAIITSNGKHANGVFSYGEGTTVNISHSIIRTTGDCSGGLMTTGGGTMNADDVTVETTGNSSAAIRSDRGGGDVNVTGGYYTTAGTGSPVIYSTADISVDSAYLESTSSQGVVVEGANSVALKDCQLIASNTSKNSDKSDYYQAVMIYQSASGDASAGTSSFSMDGGTLTNKNGDIFFVNNTACEINLTNATITNEDSEGVFLRAAAAGWGSEGSNGGNVNLTASSQEINGDVLVDSVSALNFYLTDSSTFNGAINPDGQTGDVYVEVEEGSTWTLTSDSYVSSLTCAAGSINLNGHKLYIDGEEYDGSSASTGEAVEISSGSSSSQANGGQPGGDKPAGDKPSGSSDSEPPAKPE